MTAGEILCISEQNMTTQLNRRIVLSADSLKIGIF